MEKGEVNTVKIVLDSSVIIKWFTEEEDKDRAEKIKQSLILGEVQVVVPDLLLYELSNSLRYNISLSEEEIKEAVSTIFDLGIVLLVPEEELMNNAIEASLDFNISIYDAVFLSLARILGYYLVTADEKLYEKTKSLGFVRLLKDF